MQEQMRQNKALKDERRTQLDGRTEFIFSRVSYIYLTPLDLDWVINS